MTPMIDVVFLLIIFFLVASHLSDQDSQVSLTLPDARSGEPQTESDRITINVVSPEEILLGGRPIRADETGTLLAGIKDTAGTDVEIRIRADRSIPYSTIAPLLRGCALNGFWNVTFAVRKPPEGP